MNDTVFSFLMVLLIEAIGAVFAYLRQRLMKHMYRASEYWENHSEFV